MIHGDIRMSIALRPNARPLRSCRLARTVNKAERERQLTFRACDAEKTARQNGFALLEVVCVLAIIGLLAAVILPAIPRATTRAQLEAYTVQIAALLKADRNAALRRRLRVATLINAESRTIRSGASGRLVRLPDDVPRGAMLASRCYDRSTGATIDFFPSGMSCGGVLALSRPGGG